MVPHSPTSEVSWPARNHPGRPYDQMAPYDWAIEGIFDNPTRQTSGFRNNIKQFAWTAGALILTIGAVKLHDEIVSDSLKEAQVAPPTLPTAVRRSAASAVKVRYNANLLTGREGSGVKIGPDLVLTAGHVVLKSNPGNKLECEGSYTLNSRTTSLDGADQVIGRLAIDNTSNYGAGRDMAVLRVQRDVAFDGLPTARVADNQPTAGETIFFVNYETGGPTSTVEHYPHAGLDSPTTPFKVNNYDHPAEYAGTVIGHQGPYLIAATGEAGYGPRAGREVNSYKGASGGEVLNSAGDLIGISVATGGSESVPEIRAYEGVEFPPNPSVRQISIVQPVTKKLLRPLIAGLPKSPVCYPNYDR